MKVGNIFATRWGIIGVGACIGILAPVLQKLAIQKPTQVWPPRSSN